MNPKLRLAAAFTALATAASLAGPGASQASTKGRKNTTLLLGAGSAYELLHHRTTKGLVLGAGTAYAYKKYRDSSRNDSRRRRLSRYYRYDRPPGWSHGRKTGWQGRSVPPGHAR